MLTKKIIIFDFNRTIYDPDNKKLLPYASIVLRALKRRGFYLYLISRAEKSRDNLIASLGISKYFERVILSREKCMEDFESLIPKGADRSFGFVVGDRVREEIAIGNSLGLQTIWLRQGKFAGEFPKNANERPKFVAATLKDILAIVH